MSDDKALDEPRPVEGSCDKPLPGSDLPCRLPAGHPLNCRYFLFPHELVDLQRREGWR